MALHVYRVQSMKTVLHIVGARPNFMKVAPIHRAISRQGRWAQLLVHTGQHYDVKMSDVFFADLKMPVPDIHLGVGSGSHAEQTAKVMVELEKVFLKHKPSLVSVVGDVNSTLAATLVAAKLCIPVAHVEAGLRSFDKTMPEEINRLVTDRLSDILLTPSPDADENLLKEGVDSSRIFCVGNVMIDSLNASLSAAKSLSTLKDLGVVSGQYAVCTLHRPSNVDDAEVFSGLMNALLTVSNSLPVLFPVHPRTQKMLSEGAWAEKLNQHKGLRLLEPLGYLEFLGLTSQARLVLTDSGGLQEETSALGVPCLTLRENTERPITVTLGTNVLVGTRKERIIEEAHRILQNEGKVGQAIPLWDGHAGERIAEVYENFVSH